MNTLREFKQFASGLSDLPFTMPVLFVGHGSPMNGIEDYEFSDRWKRIGEEIPVPKAVLVISAHWFTKGTKVTALDFPPTIHDFGGFPQELFDVVYPAPGYPVLASDIKELVGSTSVELSHDWGLDHGTWTVVRRMYPQANIPVIQLSIDYTMSPEDHFRMAAELHSLRKKGVLIMGSGNMVHNLRLLSWSMINGGGYDWALEANDKFKSLIMEEKFDRIIHYPSIGKEALLAVPTPEHYLPLLYTLGLKSDKDKISFFNDKAVGGSLTMTSVKLAEFQ